MFPHRMCCDRVLVGCAVLCGGAVWSSALCVVVLVKLAGWLADVHDTRTVTKT